MRSLAVVLPILVTLGSCCGLDVEYRRLGYCAKGARDMRGEEQREDSLQVFFRCPIDLGRVADDDGLACTLRFPDLPDLRGDGCIYRDLSDPVWQLRLPYHAAKRPTKYAFYADLTFMQSDLGWEDVELAQALRGRDFARVEVTIYGPGMFWRCPVSNAMVITKQELIGSLPNKTQQPTGAPSGAGGRASKTLDGPSWILP